MVMHEGFKVSEREGGARGGEGWGKRPSTPSARPSPPLRLGPRPRPLHSKRAAAGKTTRDRCLTRLPLRLLLQAQQRGASRRPQRCAREGVAGPRGGAASNPS